VTPARLAIDLGNFAATDPGEWDQLLTRARVADRVGVDRVLVVDHVVFGEHLDAYGRPELGGVAGGRQPTGPDGHWLEPLTVLGVVAGATTRVRLGTNILQAALRRPVTLAKSVATLDVLSGGRVDLGVGVGWQREEYAAAGLDFDRRGTHLDRTLSVCRDLWTSRVATIGHGDDEPVVGIHMMPKPLQPGGVPILVSGTINRAVVRRVARFGAGWVPWGPAADDVVSSISRMRQELSAEGRDPAGLRVVARVADPSSPGEPVDIASEVERLTAAGVTDLTYSAPLPRDPGELEDHLARVVDRFAEVTRG
jgi:probable F420-dependent oxidoreductase